MCFSACYPWSLNCVPLDSWICLGTVCQLALMGFRSEHKEKAGGHIVALCPPKRSKESVTAFSLSVGHSTVICKDSLGLAMSVEQLSNMLMALGSVPSVI